MKTRNKKSTCTVENCKFWYIRHPGNSKYVMTVASRRVVRNRKWSYTISMAFNSVGQEFNKSLARTVVLGRMNCKRIKPIRFVGCFAIVPDKLLFKATASLDCTNCLPLIVRIFNDLGCMGRLPNHWKNLDLYMVSTSEITVLPNVNYVIPGEVCK